MHVRQAIYVAIIFIMTFLESFGKYMVKRSTMQQNQWTLQSFYRGFSRKKNTYTYIFLK